MRLLQFPVAEQRLAAPCLSFGAGARAGREAAAICLLFASACSASHGRASCQKVFTRSSSTPDLMEVTEDFLQPIFVLLLLACTTFTCHAQGLPALAVFLLLFLH
jgi:hypothetical protein